MAHRGLIDLHWLSDPVCEKAFVALMSEPFGLS